MYSKTTEQYTKAIIRMMQEKAYKDYGTSEIRRSAHTKALGTLQARFTVNPYLPKALRVGIFKVPKTYDVWVRISNSSNKERQDNKKDVRGFAMKLETDEA